MTVRDLGLGSQVFDEEKLSALQRQVALAQNGNLISAVELHAELRERGVQFRGSSDSEIMAALLSTHEADRIEDVVADVMPRLQGAFSTVVMTKDAVVAFRDPAGLRPLALGKLGDDYGVASESCAFAIIAAELLREVESGEMASRRAFCVSEHINLAGPGSSLGGSRATVSGRKMGEILWGEAPADADVVIA